MIISNKIRRIMELKNKTKAVSAAPLFKQVLKVAAEGNKEEKESLMKFIREAYDTSGKTLIELALLRGVIDEADLKSLKCKGIDDGSFGAVLMGVFNHKEGKELNIILTAPTSKIYKYRRWIRKRFNVKVMNATEAMAHIDKQKEESKK